MNDFAFYRTKKVDSLSLALSVAIHGIVCFLLCCFPIHHTTSKTAIKQPYSVTLDLQSFTQSNHQLPHTISNSEREVKMPTTVPQQATTTSTQAKNEEQIPIKQAETQQLNIQSDEQPLSTQSVENNIVDESAVAPSLDTRGLYTGDDSGEPKKTNASLELPGWIWDVVPNPIDDTPEIGKLVFRITIDDVGEVIGIQTLETTVSPIVEQCYKNAVVNLTFSKTNIELQYTMTSVGKITFIIQNT